MCKNNEELKAEVRNLKIALAVSVIAGALCITLLAIHVIHDAHNFKYLQQTIKELHREAN